MNKKTTLFAISGAAIIIALAVAAFFAARPQETPVTSDEQDTQTYGTTNPLEGKPELNPVDKTNPFTNIKTNPFE